MLRFLPRRHQEGRNCSGVTGPKIKSRPSMNWISLAHQHWLTHLFSTLHWVESRWYGSSFPTEIRNATNGSQLLNTLIRSIPLHMEALLSTSQFSYKKDNQEMSIRNHSEYNQRATSCIFCQISRLCQFSCGVVWECNCGSAILDLSHLIYTKEAVRTWCLKPRSALRIKRNS